MQQKRLLPVIGLLAALLTACGGGSSDGEPHGSNGNNGPGPGNGGGNTSFESSEELFDARVSPSLDFCRTCHVPGGVADTEAGERFMLSRNSAEDFVKVHTAWENLGQGVEDNRILTKASNTDPEPHSGGSPWPTSSQPYNDMRVILSCWDNPAGCAALLAGLSGGGIGEQLPLLGNPGKHFFVNRICDGAPDDTPINWDDDPRRLWTEETTRQEDYATYFSEEFKICKTDALYENQARLNAIRRERGQQEIHTAHRPATTCGQWRKVVANGLRFVTEEPTTDGIFSREANYYVIENILGLEIPDDPVLAQSMLDGLTTERYGQVPSPLHNPFPMPGEDPNATNGGSLNLPIQLIQDKDDDGKWNGKTGFTCGVCHTGQLGRGEVGQDFIRGQNEHGTYIGLPNTNNEAGMYLWEIQQAAVIDGTYFNGTPLPTPGWVINHTRGTHTADQDIAIMASARDAETLNYRGPVEMYLAMAPFTTFAAWQAGDEDSPAWWWFHNKARYLWAGILSSDATRGDMLFGGFNPNDGDWNKAREGDFDDLDAFLLSTEAPNYPYGFCSNADGTPAAGDSPHCINRPLAEQGAILFHEKDMWANEQNSDIPRPKGNGACAGCHGTYSPRYANDERFLPDPRLIGMTNYKVPFNIIQTDFFGFGNYAKLFAGAYGQGEAYDASGLPVSIWWAYPDAVEGYVGPEEKPEWAQYSQGTYQGNGGPCTSLSLGWDTPPLHGVWASAPFFHNGSVPTVWDVLKPSDRPKYWLRKRVPESMAAATGDRGFDTRLEAYDNTKLGWQYEGFDDCSRLEEGIPQFRCMATQNMPGPFQMFFSNLLGGGFGNAVFQPPLGSDPVLQRMVYDTTKYTKDNAGHEWTKVLTDEERYAIIEYLKTL